MTIKGFQTLLGTALLIGTGFFVQAYTPTENATFSRAEIGKPVSTPRVVDGVMYEAFTAVQFPADSDKRLRAFFPRDLKGEITAVRNADGDYIPVKVEYTLSYDYDDKESCDSAKRLIPSAYANAATDRQILTVTGCEQPQGNYVLKRPVLLTVSQRMTDSQLVATVTPSQS